MFEQTVPGTCIKYCMVCALNSNTFSFTTQTRERVVRVSDDVGSPRVELVVPRGQVYFESEESLSKFYTSNMVSIPLHARTNSCINCACMHCYRRAIERATKPVNARTVVCS